MGQILGSMGQSGSWHVALCIPTKQGYLHSLKLTANAPENRPFSPKGKDHLPTIYLRCYLLVSGRATFIVQLSRKCYIYQPNYTGHSTCHHISNLHHPFCKELVSFSPAEVVNFSVLS